MPQNRTSLERTRLNEVLVIQDVYTLHKPLRRRFPSIPYTVYNLLHVWESDLVDVQAFSKFNDNYKYLLTVIEVFSKFLHIVPLKPKMGTSVTSAFKSILKDPKYSSLYKNDQSGCETIRGKIF